MSAAAQDRAFEAWAFLARELLRTSGTATVLNADLHHANVIDGGTRGWLAIDPKGLTGERAFDYANLFRNPDAETASAPGRLRRRADLVAGAAGLDRDRLLQWVIAYAALGAAWRIQSDEDPRADISVARIAAAARST